jgi:hypothetical protein
MKRMLFILIPAVVAGAFTGVTQAAAASVPQQCNAATRVVTNSNGDANDNGVFNDAVAALPNGGTIKVTAGTYLLDHPVLLNTDYLCVRGEPGAVIRLDPPDDQLLPGGGSTQASKYSAFTVSKQDATGTYLPISGITISDVELRLTKGVVGSSSNSVIQYNNCSGCNVLSTQVLWDDPAASADSKGKNSNGITFALGSSGVIENVVTDGMPKNGIYLSLDATDVTVDSVELRNSGAKIGVDANSNPIYWGMGISLGGSRTATISNSTMHHNKRFGILVTSIGPNYGSYHAASQATIVNVDTYANGVSNVESAGVGLGTIVPQDNVVPEDIRLTSVKSHDNIGDGVRVTAGRRITIDGGAVYGNRLNGVVLENTTVDNTNSNPPTRRIPDLTSGITLTGDLAIFGNGGTSTSALAMRAVRDVTVEQTTLHRPDVPELGSRIALYPTSTGNASTGIYLKKIDVGQKMVTYFGGAATSGNYDVTGIGNPNSYPGTGQPGLPAPQNSTYCDATTQVSYIKTDSTTTQGWASGSTCSYP